MGRHSGDAAQGAAEDAAGSAPLPAWLRRIGSGIGFTAFGLGALLLVLFAFPLVRLATRERGERTRRTRALIQWSFRLFIGLLVAIGSIRVRFRNPERLKAPGPLLIVANHPTLIDVCLLVGQVPDAECVVKREAWSNPFLGGVVRAADYIPNDGGEGLVATCVERLRAGHTLILFPEGSRSPKGGLRSFKRGAARIALQAECPVMLVDIACRPPFLVKEDPWYQVPHSLPCYTVTAHAPEPARVGGEEWDATGGAESDRVADASEARDAAGAADASDASDASDVSEASRARALTRHWRRGFEERLGHG